jgi:hypothetical protein
MHGALWGCPIKNGPEFTAKATMLDNPSESRNIHTFVDPQTISVVEFDFERSGMFINKVYELAVSQNIIHLLLPPEEIFDDVDDESDVCIDQKDKCEDGQI